MIQENSSFLKSTEVNVIGFCLLFLSRKPLDNIAWLSSSSAVHPLSRHLVTIEWPLEC